MVHSQQPFWIQSGTRVFYFKGFKKEEGIWDTLGYYDGNKQIVFICELNIVNFVYHLQKRLNRKRNRLFLMLVLRELVRLHEHAHALLHVGDFSKFPNLKDLFNIGKFQNYNSFPCYINEPLTEFIAWSTIRYLKENQIFFIKVFEEVDKDSPQYYRNWNQIKQIIDKKREHRDILYILCSWVNKNSEKKPMQGF